MNLTNLTAQVRQRIAEQSTGFISDANITALLNEGQRDFANYGASVEGIRGISLVANQARYDLPADCIPHKITHVIYDRDTKLQYLPKRTMHNIIDRQPSDRGAPVYWHIWDRKFEITPTPTSSEAASATTLNGALTSGATSITVADVSSFPSMGRVKIGSEEIFYQNTNTTTNQLLLCERADANTTAAAHASGATVSELNLQLFYYRTPTDMSAGTDTPSIPEEYHDALIYYAAAKCMEKSNESARAQYFLGLYYQWRVKAERELRRRQRDRNPRIFPGDRGYRTRLGPP